jgi:hypothetical protein
MQLTNFHGLSLSKPFDDLLFTRDALPASWLWEMKLTDQAHRGALQQLQHASPHEQAIAASFLSRWSRNLGDMEYFAHMGDLVCRLHASIGQLLRASNDCYILWASTHNVQHALFAISAQRATGRWQQADVTLAELGVTLQSAQHVHTELPLKLLAQAGVPSCILTRLPLHFGIPSPDHATSQASTDHATSQAVTASARGMALALLHCSNDAVASVAVALAHKAAMLVCIGSLGSCPSWCLHSFGDIPDGQCSCESSLQAAAQGLGGGIGLILDACSSDSGSGCAFHEVAVVHAQAAALGLPVVVYPDSYQGKHPLLSHAFVATHAPLDAADVHVPFNRALRVPSPDIIRVQRADIPAHDIVGWGFSVPAHAATLENLRSMIHHPLCLFFTPLLPPRLLPQTSLLLLV